jgi:4,5-dihydroxyphthalate decarboxylase
MLLDGELEAALYPEILPSIRNANPKVAQLFPDSKQAEIDYYKRSGIFPIMHTVVVKNHILEREPWVGISLVHAFQRAKEICYERMSDPRNISLVWVKELMREQLEIFGRDPWPYNLEDNRKALEAAVRYEFCLDLLATAHDAKTIVFGAEGAYLETHDGSILHAPASTLRRNAA